MGESVFSSSNVTEEGVAKVGGRASELEEMEEDGEATFTSLGVVGMIVTALSAYVLYWFCCSASSKGYRQQQFMNGKGYYEEDLDTDEYARRHQMRYKSYSDGIAGGHGDRDDDSDWSEDEQLGVDVHDDHTKGRKQKRPYDVTVHDMNSMPIHNETTDDYEEDEDETDDLPQNGAV